MNIKFELNIEQDVKYKWFDTQHNNIASTDALLKKISKTTYRQHF
jgi:hypothetical protein